MVKIYSHVAGNTLMCHKKILKKLKRNGAKVVTDPMKSDAMIVFCPIVSRYMTDINSALSNLPESSSKKKVVVALHHTFDPDYPLPRHTDTGDEGVDLRVDCLFFEGKGLLHCARNKEAIRAIRKKLKIKKQWKKIISQITRRNSHTR